jgi:hypothetical protein
MSYLKQHVRLVVLMMGLVGAAVLFGSVVGNNEADRAQAAATFDESVSCADAYLDLSLANAFIPAPNPNDARIGDPPAGGTLRVAKSLTRLDPTGGPAPTGVQSSQQLYLGPDVPGFEPPETPFDVGLGEIVPDGPPDTESCIQKAANANAGAEAGQLGAVINGSPVNTKLAAVSVFRPSDGTVVSKPKANIIMTDGCVFSDTFGWIRQVTMTEQTTTAAKGVNNGIAALMLGTANPTGQVDVNGNTVPDYSTNPSSCTGGTPFTTWTQSTVREPSSDCPPIPAPVVADPSGDGGDGCGGVEPADTADGLADDWDGDGCTDYDELRPGNPITAAGGLDPFNPEDCQNNPAGTYNISVSNVKGAKFVCTEANTDTDFCDGKPAGTVVQTAATSFHCVAEIAKGAPVGGISPLTGAAVCYTDSIALGGATGSAVPSWSDGNSGAPVPPPYGTSTVALGVDPGLLATNSRYDSATSTARSETCFLETGSGALSPNVLAIATWNTKTGVGTVEIRAQLSNADCLAGNQAAGVALITSPITFTRQKATGDKDNDGCTDAQEIAVLTPTAVLPTGTSTNPDGKCGDDPYNPNDGPNKTNLGGSYDLQVTAVMSDRAAPGANFHCKADINESPDNVLTVRPACYIDNPAIDINPTAAGVQAGDGLQGAPPPGTTGTCLASAGPPAQASRSCYIPLDNTPTVLNGTVTGNVMAISGCFEAGAPPGPLGNVYVTATADTKTGVGEADIYVGQTLANCNAGTPAGAPTFDDAVVEIARQAPRVAGWDSDRDGCSDQEELGTNPNLGGLRDPYNRWDFYDVWTGATKTTKDRAVAAADINGVLGRFGATDAGPFRGIDRNSDPNTATPVPLASAPLADRYHPAYDRGAAVAGGLGWQRTQPDGSITGTDFNATLAQFGASCVAAPNPPSDP